MNGVASSRILLLSDFNVEGLARQLAHSTMPGAETRTSGGAPVMAALAAGSPGPEWTAVVWSQPEAVIPTFARALAFEAVDHQQAIDEALRYGEAAASFAANTRTTFVPTFTLPPWRRGYGPLDFRAGIGVAHLLARVNLTVADALRDTPQAVLLDAAKWVAALGPRAWSEKLWFATKSPFTPALYEHAAADIASAIAGIDGRSRKLVIVDLDDVLWGGVVGEVGLEGLRLGGHDHVGESFVAFQRELKALTRRGVQLAIVSKNDERVALDAIDLHPEMHLKRDDFAAWKINWDDKAANVDALLTELGLAADSAVFIDDSANERARVATAIPDVLVPDWPTDPARYREALAALRCFDAPMVSAEDRARANMYAAERSRRTERSLAATATEWLETLGVEVAVEPLSVVNLERAAQLFNKTNQMNLSTRRLSGAELIAWAADPSQQLITFRVADRFGDSGLTGIIGLSFEGRCARLVDFVLSCRVIGRGAEEAMLHVAVGRARSRGGIDEISADFLPTKRNLPCLEFFRRSGWESVAESRFRWLVANRYPPPTWVVLRGHAAVAAADDR